MNRIARFAAAAASALLMVAVPLVARADVQADATRLRDSRTAERFNLVGIEVYPMNAAEYALLHECGADYVCVFQETYDPARYAAVHRWGPKRDYAARLAAVEHALAAELNCAPTYVADK